METTANKVLTVTATIDAPIEKVWGNWTKPEHITKWTNPSEDWHAPRAENDLREGGKFSTRMEAKDGSMGFDFAGVYTSVINHKHIAYTLEDDRKVSVDFSRKGNQTEVVEKFEAENSNPIEMQQGGWQAILDNFKKYTEET